MGKGLRKHVKEIKEMSDRVAQLREKNPTDPEIAVLTAKITQIVKAEEQRLGEELEALFRF